MAASMRVLLLGSLVFVLSGCGSSSATKTVTVTSPGTTDEGTTTVTQGASADTKVVVAEAAIIPAGKTGNDHIYDVGFVMQNRSESDAHDLSVQIDLVDSAGTIVASSTVMFALLPAHQKSYAADKIFTAADATPTKPEFAVDVGQFAGTGGDRPRLSNVRFKREPYTTNYTVTGIEMNTLDYAVNGHVDALLFDRGGTIVGAGAGGAEPDTLPPGRRAVFTVDFIQVTDPARVAYARATAGAAPG